MEYFDFMELREQLACLFMVGDQLCLFYAIFPTQLFHNQLRVAVYD